MSIYDKSIKNVAEAAAKIMDEALKGNQHKIDANKNNKIDSQDFKLLRAGKKPEQVKEEIDLQEKSDDYEVKQSKTDPDVHHVHYKGKKIGYVYGNKDGKFGVVDKFDLKEKRKEVEKNIKIIEDFYQRKIDKNVYNGSFKQFLKHYGLSDDYDNLLKQL